MAVEEKTQTEEQKAAEAQDLDTLKAKLFKSLDAEPDQAPEKDKPGDEQDEEQPETVETTDADKPAEKDAEDEEADQDAEVIPKSKVDKMLARQEQRISQLTARLRQLEGAPKTVTVGDPERDKLLAMSAPELRALKREVRMAQATEKDAGKLASLVDLELKIDDVAADAPTRFASRQVELYNAAADALLEDEALTDLDTAAPKIRSIAQDIYGRYPKLQRLEEGQAIALQLAAEHYKATQAGTNGTATRSTVEDLKRKMNTLKRKTSLDTSRSRGIGTDHDLHKLREKAFRGADDRDRIALIRKDPLFGVDAMIPEEFKEA